MKILTLTTDYGLQDYYLASYKGLIYKSIRNINIVDISSTIFPFDLQQGVFNLSNAWKNFPTKTIHQFRVGEELLRTNRFLLCEHEEQYFLLPDNGVITMLFPFQLPKTIVAVENDIATRSNSAFLAKIIAHIADTDDIAALGNETTIYKEKLLQQPISSNDYIRGIIQYKDRYGNLITNITKELFEQVQQNRNFKIRFRVVEFTKLHQSYNEVVNDKICCFNSAGFLQLSFYHGNASELYGLRVSDSIQIDFS